MSSRHYELPTSEIRSAIMAVAAAHGEPDDWMNDAAKNHFPANPPQASVVADLPALKVLCPPPEYILAMKCASARVDTHDYDDVKTLMRITGMRTARRVLDLVSEYYPNHVIPAKTTYFVEEASAALSRESTTASLSPLENPSKTS